MPSREAKKSYTDNKSELSQKSSDVAFKTSCDKDPEKSQADSGARSKASYDKDPEKVVPIALLLD